MHRPSPSIVISLAALVVAMSGTAYAATGGTFILGKHNTATSVSSLTNTEGTALSLSSTSTTPPLRVNNSVQVPKLNASLLGGQAASAFLPITGTAANSSELGGQPASAFLPATGTAVNSSELGGIPASGFTQGSGTTSGGRATLTGTATQAFLSAPGSVLTTSCDYQGTDEPGATMYLTGQGQITWWDQQTTVQHGNLTGNTVFLTQFTTTKPDLVVAQVDEGTSISTYTLTQNYDQGTDSCTYTGQVLTTNG
jgi:hypothetical protein